MLAQGADLRGAVPVSRAPVANIEERSQDLSRELVIHGVARREHAQQRVADVQINDRLALVSPVGGREKVLGGWSQADEHTQANAVLRTFAGLCLLLLWVFCGRRRGRWTLNRDGALER